MLEWLFRDWGVKLGAGLLAASLWFHAVTEREYRRNLDIPVVVENPATPAGQSPLVLAAPVPATVRVAVIGRGKSLLRASPSDFLLRVQAPSAPPGRAVNLRLAPSQVEQLGGGPTLQVETILEPDDVEIVLDHREERVVPIRARIDLRLAESYTQVGPAQVRPDSVHIRGPRKQVQQIDAVTTDTLFRADVRATVDTELDLTIPEDRQVSLAHERVAVHVDVQELAEYEIPNVPVTVVGGPAGAVAEPSRVTVRVRGGADLIGSLDPETDLGLRLDYGAATEAAGGPIRAPEDRLYEVRQILPPRATVVIR